MRPLCLTTLTTGADVGRPTGVPRPDRTVSPRSFLSWSETAIVFSIWFAKRWGLDAQQRAALVLGEGGRRPLGQRVRADLTSLAAKSCWSVRYSSATPLSTW